MTKITVYPEVKFFDRAWRIKNVYVTKEALTDAGIPILGEHQIPNGMIYAQQATLHDLDKADVIKLQVKKIHELEIAKSAAADVIAQKDIELRAKQFVCCSASCPAAVESWDLVSLDDELLRQIAKKLTSVCTAWESKHGSKLQSSDITRFSDGKFDAMLTAAATQEKNLSLQEKIDDLSRKVALRNQVICAFVLGFVIEQVLRFIAR